MYGGTMCIVCIVCCAANPTAVKIAAQRGYLNSVAQLKSGQKLYHGSKQLMVQNYVLYVSNNFHDLIDNYSHK